MVAALRRRAIALPLVLATGFAAAQSGAIDPEPERIAWRDANEAVARIGGWREYAREIEYPRSPDPIAGYLGPEVEDAHADAFATLGASLAIAALPRRLHIRRAWIEAIAARQHLAYVGKLHESAAATAELAGRMAAIGNAGRRASAREQLVHADTALVLASARHGALSSHERLARSLQLDPARLDALSLPQRLPDVPGESKTLSEAIDRTTPDDSNVTHSMLRESWLAYRSSHEIALLHRERILPLRATISEERLYEYNGMLIGVFELLVDSRTAIQAVLRAIDASRRFWLADVDLQGALDGLPRAEPVPSADPGAIDHQDAHGGGHGDAHDIGH